MTLSRRAALAGAAASAALPAAAQAPARPDFPSVRGTFLNSASVHPWPRATADAVARYAEGRLSGAVAVNSADVQGKFARLINATPAEIATGPSTSMAEYLVAAALGLTGGRGRVVTDALHFVGSLYLYQQLEARGVVVVLLPMRPDGSVDPAEFDRAVTPGTTLVAVSHVSFVNGFEHDMPALCRLAHARGALVLADIIQSAGAMPVDVRGWDADFATCGTYKWLMGDFGFAFLYVKAAVRERLARPWIGYTQASNFFNPPTSLFPHDAPGEPAVRFTMRPDLGGLFNGAFPARAAEVAVGASLDMILARGADSIQAARQPLVDALQRELRGRGWQGITPVGTRSPIVSFAVANAASLAPRLQQAGVTVTLTGNRLRVSPSLFNDMADIERLVAALGRA